MPKGCRTDLRLIQEIQTLMAFRRRAEVVILMEGKLTRSTTYRIMQRVRPNPDFTLYLEIINDRTLPPDLFLANFKRFKEEVYHGKEISDRIEESHRRAFDCKSRFSQQEDKSRRDSYLGKSFQCHSPCHLYWHQCPKAPFTTA